MSQSDLIKALRERVALDADNMADKFLCWPLPKSVHSDLCVTDNSYPFPRMGTNLLTADEAKLMVDYLLSESALAPLLSSLIAVVEAAEAWEDCSFLMEEDVAFAANRGAAIARSIPMRPWPRSSAFSSAIPNEIYPVC